MANCNIFKESLSFTESPKHSKAKADFKSDSNEICPRGKKDNILFLFWIIEALWLKYYLFFLLIHRCDHVTRQISISTKWKLQILNYALFAFVV